MDHDARIKALKDLVAANARRIREHEKEISVLFAANLSALSELKEVTQLRKLTQKYRGSKT